MRKLSFLFLVVFFLFLFSSGIVFGLQQNQVSTTISWSKRAYYQGEEGSLAITLNSQCPDELKIHTVEVHFDWTNNHKASTLYFSEDPVGIPSNGDYIFDSIHFQVPQNATEEFHNIQVKLSGTQHGIWWYDFEWISNETQIEIKTNYEQLYNQLNPQTSKNLTETQNANYQNPDAIELLNNATIEYNLAKSNANQKEWQQAVSHLQQVEDLLTQAQQKEHTQTPTEDLTTTVGAIVVLVVLGLIVSIVFGRKSKKT